MKISERLKTVASFVPRGSNVADIGTDHGYIPIYLVENGVSGRAVAADVRRGPLQRALSHIQEHGLEDRIAVRLSDGLTGFRPGEADCVVIAGLGGELLIRILEEGRHMWDSVRFWVLSPQSDLERVRRFLERQSFSIDRETMLKEDGKYYTVMRAERGTMDCGSVCGYRYGRLLIEEGNPVLREFLEKEKRQKEAILSSLVEQSGQKAREREAQLREELAWIEEAQYEMQGTDRDFRAAGSARTGL